MRHLWLIPCLLLAGPALADMYPDAGNAKLPEARTNLGLSTVSARDFGARGDGISRPLNTVYGSKAVAAANCPSLNLLAGPNATTGDTHSNTTLDNVQSSIGIVYGAAVSGAGIPVGTTVADLATNVAGDGYVVSLSQAATATAANTAISFSVNWATIEADWCGIQGAFDYARANGGGGMMDWYRSVTIPDGGYVVNQPLNLTCFGTDCLPTPGFRGVLNVKMEGANLYCNTIKGACLDATGSRSVNLYGGVLYAPGNSPTTSPKIGLLMGMRLPWLAAHPWNIYDTQTHGCFSLAALYNRATEVANFNGTHWLNFTCEGMAPPSNAAGPYAVVLDGGNHWRIASPYIATPYPQHARSSFNDNVFINGSIQGYNPSGAPGNHTGSIWLYQNRRLHLQATYLRTGDGICARVFVDNLEASFSDVNTGSNIFEAHCEHAPEGTPTAYLLITTDSAAPTTSPYLLNWQFYLAGNMTPTFFKRDTAAGIDTVNLEGRTAVTWSTTYGTGPWLLFDDPAKFNLRSIDEYKLPNTVSGFFPVIGTAACTGMGTGGVCAALGPAAKQGKIKLTAGTAAAALGVFDIAYPFKFLGAPGCVMMLSTLNSNWDPRATASGYTFTASSFQVRWDNNGVPLTPGDYGVDYVCDALN